MTIDRAGIERLVPHAGTMVLLDTVMHWNTTHIVCSAAAPDPSHPLARDGVVPSVIAVEYAAQAAAVHGALLDGRAAPTPGVLAKLTQVKLHTAHMPTNCGLLAVNAELIRRGAAGCVYNFEIACVHEIVASGRLMVAFMSPSAR